VLASHCDMIDTNMADRRVEMTEQLQRIGLLLQSCNIALFEAIEPTDPAGFPAPSRPAVS